MKRGMVLAVLTTLFALTWYMNSQAAGKDEKNSMSHWNNQGSYNENKPRAEIKLQEQFGATDTQINNLRQQNLNYGEIRQTFSLAQKMPGGITDKNIQRVVDTRQGSGHKIGWSQVSQQLGIEANEDRDWNNQNTQNIQNTTTQNAPQQQWKK